MFINDLRPFKPKQFLIEVSKRYIWWFCLLINDSISDLLTTILSDRSLKFAYKDINNENKKLMRKYTQELIYAFLEEL